MTATYDFPAEWEAHQRTWMAWPRSQTWGDGWQDAETVYAAVANTISEYEPVIMLCDASSQASVKKRLSSQIECWVFDYDDAWLRDNGPIFIRNPDGQLCITGWNFNGWGDQFRPWDQDQTLARRIAQQLQIDYIEANIIAEGGALNVDGQGCLLTTEQCLLNDRRNPNLEQTDIEAELQRLTGAQQIIWLPQGLEDDHTDGHVDELACFARPGTVLLCGCEDDTDPNYTVVKAARQRLQDSGKASETVDLPQPDARYMSDGVRLTLSYINFYLANHSLIMPSFEQSRYDANAKAILAEQFPQRDIHQLPALPIVVGGGGIHCITQQQPASHNPPATTNRQQLISKVIERES